MIIVALEMKQAVNQVANQLGLPSRAEAARLRHRNLPTNENLSPKRLIARLGIVECQNVRRTGMAQKGFVEAGHFWQRDGEENEVAFRGAGHLPPRGRPA